MYEPFVRACNSALDELSIIKVDGLPAFELEKQIVFVDSSHRSIKSTSHWRNPQAKPDIVLLGWNLFLQRLSTSRFDKSVTELAYSESHMGDFCISETGLDLSWRVVRSRVEMKLKGLPNNAKLPKDFDDDFWALEETASYASHNDDIQPTVVPLEVSMPSSKCEHVSSGRIFVIYLFLQMPLGPRLDCRR